MAKPIREVSGKRMLTRHLEHLLAENGLGKDLSFPMKTATVTPTTDFDKLVKDNPWLATEVSVQKPKRLRAKQVYYLVGVSCCDIPSFPPPPPPPPPSNWLLSLTSY